MKKETTKSIIGILGGMGPQASAYLLKLLVDLSARKFSAKNCEDFPEVILNSIPHPDFISDKKNKRAALKILKKRVRQLNEMQVGVLGIACNTAHILLDKLQLVSKAPFISIVEEIIKELRRKRINKVGLLASPTTFESGIFQKAFRPERSVWPERWVYHKTDQNTIKNVRDNYSKGYRRRD